MEKHKSVPYELLQKKVKQMNRCEGSIEFYEHNKDYAD
jgi:hypothetical protein